MSLESKFEHALKYGKVANVVYQKAALAQGETANIVIAAPEGWDIYWIDFGEKTTATSAVLKSYTGLSENLDVTADQILTLSRVNVSLPVTDIIAYNDAEDSAKELLTALKLLGSEVKNDVLTTADYASDSLLYFIPAGHYVMIEVSEADGLTDLRMSARVFARRTEQ